MAEPETRQTKASVKAFLDGVEPEQKRKDGRVILRTMQEVTGVKAAMWGPSIVGFGHHHYEYESGREGDWFLSGFSPRKQSLTLYVMPGFEEYGPLLKKLGKHKTGKSCLYIDKLDDVDTGVLRELIERSVRRMRAKG